MVDSSDQRDYRRMPIICPMSFRVGGSHKAYEAKARNISSTGILFTTEHALQTGDSLVINVTPEQAVVEPLNARAEVVRVDSLAEGHYQVACKIKEFLT